VSVGDPVLRQLALAVGDAPDFRAIRRLLIVPLVGRGGALAVLTLGIDQTGRAFTADECRLAETVAADIAAAIEQARLVERARADAVAEERARLARELHDSVTQSLYAIAIVAEALPRVLDRAPAEAVRNAEYLRHTTLGALAELRALLFELRPSALAAAKLSTLLHQQADALRGRTRIAVAVTVDGDADLPPDAKIGLYRIVQEVFNNIARHARATRVVADLRASPSRIAIAIADDGVGFAPGAAPADRMGLHIMRERAQALGADLLVVGRPGQGTRVTIVWPAGQVEAKTHRSAANATTAPATVVRDTPGGLHHLPSAPETPLGGFEAAL
jgi:signal transduction histidine kinase